jgi:cyanate permease
MNQDRTANTSLNDVPAATTGLGLGAALTCIMLVDFDLRPGLVSMGPLLPAIRHDFGLSLPSMITRLSGSKRYRPVPS